MSLKTLDKIYLIGVTDGHIDGSSTTAPQSRGSSPPRRGLQLFNMISSRPTTPNVFDIANGSNRPIHTDFTGGALSNAPVLRPGHNFSSGAPASAANDAPMTTPLGSPDANMTSPPRGRDRGDAIMSSPPRDGDGGDTTMSSPVRTRDEERAAHNAPLAARLLQAEQERELREHEQRKAEAARRHEELLQGDRDYALGNFEPDEPANSAMDTIPTNTAPADADMVNSPAGNATPGPTQGQTPFTPPRFSSPVVEGSAQELAVLREFPHNGTGAHDAIYRAYSYVWPDAFDDITGEPVYQYSPPP